MGKVNTSDLVGPALDWAVAKACGWVVEVKPISTYSNASTGHKEKATGYRIWMVSDVEPEECAPSSDWSQGGPLVEKYRIELRESGKANWWADKSMLREGTLDKDDWCGHGPTALIAICRAVVAGQLGEVVQVPTGLLI